jgi:hypothetical protein
MTVGQFEVVTSAALYQFQKSSAGFGPEAGDVPRDSRKGRVNNLAKGRIIARDYREIPGTMQPHFMRHAQAGDGQDVALVDERGRRLGI